MGLYRKLVGYRSRSTYWSCSKFAENVRVWFSVDEKPKAATAEGWHAWREKNLSKFGYWLTEEAFDAVQDIIYFPVDVYRNIKRYVTNRFIDKPHYLDTKLKRGEWHEMDTRILHGLFETLVDFVEHEKANMQYCMEQWQEDKPNKINRKFPSREKGLMYLDWEIGLGDESPLQSEAAREVKTLYLWWKDIRNARPDPMDASGWSDYCDETRKDGDSWIGLAPVAEKDRDRISQMLDATRDLEEQYEEEDTEMLIRLIHVRRQLWT